MNTALALILVPLALPASVQQDSKQVLTLEQASGRADAPSFSDSVERWRWAPDGQHLRTGSGADEKWFDPRTGAEVPKPAGEPAADDEAEAGERPARSRSGRGRARFDDESPIGKALAAARARGSVELADANADESRVAFVRDNDLIVVDVATGRELALTTDGSDEQFNGKLDWVYQEEIYGRGNFKGFWWSPDGDHIAFLSLNEAPVHEFTVVDHIEEGHFRVKAEVSNYPKVGDPNPIVSVAIADARTGDLVWVDLGAYRESEPLVVRIEWTPSGDRCLIGVQDRIQTWADLLAVDPGTGSAVRWIRETSSTWTDRPDALTWLEDGTFLWRSARTGYEHVYRYRQGGELVCAVTAGDWSVRGIREVDEERGILRFTSSEGGAVDVNLYQVGLDGSGYVRLTEGPGTHSIAWNGDQSLFVDTVSRLDTPSQVRLCDAGGKVLRVLAEGSVPAEATHHVARYELLEIPARDGFLMDAAILRPVPFDEQRAYPVWVSTYSGPDSSTVRNRWSSSAWFQFLAQQGVIVLQCNVRTASGKGHWAISQCYKRLGLQEIDDLSDAVDWLCAHPWADASRVGITGYSFGGFMACGSLLFTDKFALGIAGGGVYDWRLYDTIYTERYMATPATNLEGYEATSCLGRAGKLHGFLHMHHGVMDDNVHLQNMLMMAHALMKAGKTNWSMMAYPQTRHGIRDADLSWHARRREWELIREHLRPAYASPQEATAGQ